MDEKQLKELTQMLKENSVNEIFEDEKINEVMQDCSVSELLQDEEVKKDVMKVLKELSK